MSYWVYVHTCPNGKKYVGITTAPRPEYRWLEGRGYKHQLFGRAVRKYGWSSIKHEAWELTSESEMYYAEKYLIAYYHTTDNKFGYNRSEGGESGSSGCRCSEESKKKMSEAAKERWSDPEYRKKLSEAHKGKILSEEQRKKISETLKDSLRSEEAKKKKSGASKKNWLDPEYRRKQSEAKKGKPCSEETKKKISQANKGRTFSEEHRKKLSETRKERAKDPEFRKKMSEAHKGKLHSEETKKKMSEAQKKNHSDPEFRRKMSEANKGKPKPKVKIKLPEGTVIEITKQALTRYYINKGKEFEYVS